MASPPKRGTILRACGNEFAALASLANMPNRVITTAHSCHSPSSQDAAVAARLAVIRRKPKFAVGRTHDLRTNKPAIRCRPMNVSLCQPRANNLRPWWWIPEFPAMWYARAMDILTNRRSLIAHLGAVTSLLGVSDGTSAFAGSEGREVERLISRIDEVSGALRGELISIGVSASTNCFPGFLRKTLCAGLILTILPKGSALRNWASQRRSLILELTKEERWIFCRSCSQSIQADPLYLTGTRTWSRLTCRCLVTSGCANMINCHAMSSH